MPKKQKKALSRVIIDSLIDKASVHGISVSERSIMEEFAVSRPTANKILSELALRGYAFRGKGRPTIIKPRQNRAFTAHFLLPDANALDHYALPDNYRINLRLMRGAMQEAQKHDCVLSFTLIDPNDFSSDLERLLRISERPVFMLSSTRQYAAFIEHCRGMNLPLMLFTGQGPAGHCVYFNGGEAIRSLIRYTASSGRNAFLMIEHRDRFASASYKREAFLSAAKDAGVRGDVISITSLDEIPEKLSAAFRIGGYDCVFGSNDTIAMLASDTIAKLGAAAGKEYTLIGYDNTPEANAYRPLFSTVDVPLEEIGALLVKGAAAVAEDMKCVYAVHVEAHPVLR
ncbi:MAG: substrate-binding domain-containing protein [Spirochaetota bacterium]